jgi:hypothetical protein
VGRGIKVSISLSPLLRFNSELRAAYESAGWLALFNSMLCRKPISLSLSLVQQIILKIKSTKIIFMLIKKANDRY